MLAVDDEEANRALLEAVLEERYTVLQAENGARALEVLAEQSVDLVLLDVIMPKLDGFQACRAIKARQGEPFLPVILLTGLDDRQHRLRGLEAGADELITKPFDRQELLLRVANMLRIRQQELLLRAHTNDVERLQVLKDDLVSLVVHDMRNPLFGVLGYLELLDAALTDGEEVARRNASAALAAARHLQVLLDQVLEVQRLERAEVPLNLEPGCAIQGLLSEVAETLQGGARMRGIALDVQADDGVRGPVDRSLVRRALENLVVNALKVTEDGGEVTLSAYSTAGGVVIEVADRGPGISHTSVHRIFRRFATGDSARGFGLGLHLVQLVVKAHGGSYEVRDRKGGGSVVAMTFPAAECALPVHPDA